LIAKVIFLEATYKIIYAQKTGLLTIHVRFHLKSFAFNFQSKDIFNFNYTPIDS